MNTNPPQAARLIIAAIVFPAAVCVLPDRLVLGSSYHAARGLMQAEFRDAHRLLSGAALPILDSPVVTKLRARLAQAATCAN